MARGEREAKRKEYDQDEVEGTVAKEGLWWEAPAYLWETGDIQHKSEHSVE